MEEKASRLEEGIFGLANVKLGADAKEQRVLLRSVSCFRRFALTVFITLVSALGCVVRYRYRASHMASALEAADLKRSAAECGLVVEGILLKQDEVDELTRRLQQRRLFDRFLDAEKEVEEMFRLRVLNAIDNGSEGQERKLELRTLFAGELQWFMDTVDARVEEIIGPLDAAFRDIPEQIHVLQDEIKGSLPAFGTGGACADLERATAGARWESLLKKRVRQMIDVVGKSPVSKTDSDARLIDFAQSWIDMRSNSESLEISAELIVHLLRWYAEADVQSLSLLWMQVRQAKVPSKI